MSGSSDQTLNFVVQFKNEASSALSDLQAQIEKLSQNVGQLSQQHTTATAAVSGHTSAVKQNAAELQETATSFGRRPRPHSQLAEKLNEGARALGGLGSIVGEIGPVALGVAGAIGLIGEQAVESVDKFAEFEAIGVRLDATMKAMGQTAKISVQDIFEAALGSLPM